MKNMKLTLGSAIFCLGAATLFTACGDDSSSSSDTGSKEIVSCHTYNTVDEEGLEINEDCIEAEKGTASADTAKLACEAFTAFMVKLPKGTGLKSDRAAPTRRLSLPARRANPLRCITTPWIKISRRSLSKATMPRPAKLSKKTKTVLSLAQFPLEVACHL